MGQVGAVGSPKLVCVEVDVCVVVRVALVVPVTTKRDVAPVVTVLVYEL